MRARSSSRLALGGQGDAAGRPHEQRRPHPLLEPPDVPRQRLLRHEQPRRRPREVELLRDGHERAQGPDLEVDVRRSGLRIHALSMLVEREQVLDVARDETQGWGHQASHRHLKP